MRLKPRFAAAERKRRTWSHLGRTRGLDATKVQHGKKKADPAPWARPEPKNPLAQAGRPHGPPLLLPSMSPGLGTLPHQDRAQGKRHEEAVSSRAPSAGCAKKWENAGRGRSWKQGRAREGSFGRLARDKGRRMKRNQNRWEGPEGRKRNDQGGARTWNSASWSVSCLRPQDPPFATHRGKGAQGINNAPTGQGETRAEAHSWASKAPNEPRGDKGGPKAKKK